MNHFLRFAAINWIVIVINLTFVDMISWKGVFAIVLALIGATLWLTPHHVVH